MSKSEATAVSSEALAVQAISAGGLTPQLIEQWERLEDRALEANAFLSPHFVLPAWKHLTPEIEPVLLLVQADRDGESHLVGLGVFEASKGTLMLPWPHLKCYRSKHSYLEGLLIDAECAPAVVTALFEFLGRQTGRWHGLSFFRRNADSALAVEIQESAAQLGMRWFPDWSINRAIIRPAEIPSDCLDQIFAKQRKKELLKKRDKLRKAHDVEFRVRRCGPDYPACVDRLLELESMGWKGEEQSALACRPNEVTFLQEMAAGFAGRNRLLFTELVLDGAVISTKSHLISGRAAFTFKIGWHTDYAKWSPGRLNALEMLVRAPEDLSDLDYVDSCSTPGSFYEETWLARRTITSGVFTTSRRASACTSVSSKVLSQLRTVKHYLRKPR